MRTTITTVLACVIAGGAALTLTGVAQAQSRKPTVEAAPAPAVVANEIPFTTPDTPEWVLEARREAVTDHYPRSVEAPVGTLRPRRMIPKLPTSQIELPELRTGRLVVKFADDIQARIVDGSVVSRTGADLTAVAGIMKTYGLTVEPLYKKSEARLAAMEARAQSLSGYEQPDLAGAMIFSTPAGVTLDCAAAFNALDVVEVLNFEPQYKPAYGGATGACCIPLTFSCVIETANMCITLGGNYQGDGTVCGASNLCGACCLPNGQCLGDRTEDSCTDMATGGTYGGDATTCPDIQPCTDVDELDCMNPASGSCYDYTEHLGPPQTPFCFDAVCCPLVCAIDPFCCDADVFEPGRGFGWWDPWCADHAFVICAGGVDGGGTPAGPDYDPNAATPNLSDAQGYFTRSQWALPLTDNIVTALRWDPTSTVFMDGYTGEGYDMELLWNIGETLANDDGLGPNRTRGFGLKTGVIDFSAFVAPAIGPDAPYGHEDLDGAVVSEPGQTPLVIPYLTSFTGHHGTAALGVIGAIDQTSAGVPRSAANHAPSDSLSDQLGMLGLASESATYFFPAVSVQEPAGRLDDAIMSAADVFGPGDVLAMPFAQGNGLLITSPATPTTWLSVRFATDMGITCVIAAGNECADIGDVDQAEAFGLNSGAVVVGAVLPGCDVADGQPGFILGPPFPPDTFNCYCRMYMSNYGLRVDISSWGDAVATLGLMGSVGPISPSIPPADIPFVLGPRDCLFEGNVGGVPSLSRTYTNCFRDTSAATSLVAALTSCMQGLAVQFFNDGTALAPGQIRGVISNNGTLQCAGNDDRGGPSGMICPTSSNTVGFGSSWANGDWTNGDEPGIVGGVVFTNTGSAANSMLTAGWFDENPGVTGIEILEGHLISGTVLALKTPSDGIRLVVGSTGSLPSGPGVSERGNIASGKVTDVLVRGNTLGAAPDTELTLEVQSTVNTGAGIMLVYLYNYNTLHWQIGGVTFLVGTEDDPGTNGLIVPFPIPFAEPFINPADGEVKIRLWTVSSSTLPDYQVSHDYVAFNFLSSDFVPGGP